LVEIFRLNVIDVGHATMTLEVQGREDKMSAIVDLLEPYGEWAGLLPRVFGFDLCPLSRFDSGVGVLCC
jgi:hypothetical protein